MKECIARANAIRSILCLIFPFAALVWYYQKITASGVSITEYPSAIIQSGSNVVSFAFVFGGIVAWIIIVWPKAILALRYRSCAIDVDGTNIRIYGDRFRIEEVRAVDIKRKVFKIDLELTFKSSPMAAYSVILLSPKPDEILAKVKTLIGAPTPRIRGSRKLRGTQ